MSRYAILSAFIVFSVLLSGCGNTGRRSMLPDGVILKTGDIVLRCGYGLTSNAVRVADGGGIYSHVGIVVDSAGCKMICHAVPGEADFEGAPDRVKLDAPEVFFGSDKTDVGCVMRCEDSIKALVAADIALSVYRRGTFFDHDYNESDTTEMYCCELVEHAYIRAGHPLTGGKRSNYAIPGMDFDNVILPSQFRGSPHLELVIEF